MPWRNDDAARQHTRDTYNTPEYRRNRAIARRRANGRCEGCGAKRQLQCDHRIPVTQGGTHDPANLQMLCQQCHAAKTAGEGGGYRQAADPQPRQRTRWVTLCRGTVFARSPGRRQRVG